MSRGLAPHAVRRRMNKETQMMLVPQGSIEGYIRAANEYPMLTAEEEKSLAERLYYDGDIEAAKKLVLSHLRFVIHVARGYSGYGLPQADLIQEGNIGLMKAVKRFNPEVGVRLVSFAVHWIKAEIHEYAPGDSYSACACLWWWILRIQESPGKEEGTGSGKA